MDSGTVGILICANILLPKTRLPVHIEGNFVVGTYRSVQGGSGGGQSEYTGGIAHQTRIDASGSPGGKSALYSRSPDDVALKAGGGQGAAQSEERSGFPNDKV